MIYQVTFDLAQRVSLVAAPRMEERPCEGKHIVPACLAAVLREKTPLQIKH